MQPSGRDVKSEETACLSSQHPDGSTASRGLLVTRLCLVGVGESLLPGDRTRGDRN